MLGLLADAPSSLCLPLQFRYKRRVYSQPLLDDKQFAKLHTKVSRGPGGVGGCLLAAWRWSNSRGGLKP